jgi:hypothetical protein
MEPVMKPDPHLAMEREIIGGAFTDREKFLSALTKQLSTYNFYKQCIHDREPDTVFELSSMTELLDKDQGYFAKPESLEKKMMARSLLWKSVQDLFAMNWLDVKRDVVYPFVHDRISGEVADVNPGAKRYDQKRFYALLHGDSALVSILNVQYAVTMKDNYSLSAIAYATIRGPLAAIGSPLAFDVKSHFESCGLQILNDKAYDGKINQTSYPLGSITAEGIKSFILQKKILPENVILRVVDEKASYER